LYAPLDWSLASVPVKNGGDDGVVVVSASKRKKNALFFSV
jgi:hypothetical protein